MEDLEINDGLSTIGSGTNAFLAQDEATATAIRPDIRASLKSQRSIVGLDETRQTLISRQSQAGQASQGSRLSRTSHRISTKSQHNLGSEQSQQMEASQFTRGSQLTRTSVSGIVAPLAMQSIQQEDLLKTAFTFTSVNLHSSSEAFADSIIDVSSMSDMSAATTKSKIYTTAAMTYAQPPPDATIMYEKTDDTQPKVYVTFDKNEILKKIDKLTFNEARRFQKYVYDTIVQELYEEAAPCWAQHFSDIFAKEQQLLEEKTITHGLNYNREFLFELIDKIKKSNRALIESNGIKVAFKHLYDAMLLVEPNEDSFDWFVKIFYDIIAHLCNNVENLETGAYEVVARIYFKYSKYLDLKLKDYPSAILWMNKALKMVQGELWLAVIGEDGLTLHEVIAPTYSELLMKYSNEMLRKDFHLATKLSNQAILVVCEVGIQKFEKQFCRAHLHSAKILTDVGEMQKALKLLHYVEDLILNAQDISIKEMSTEYYYLHGTCLLKELNSEGALNKEQYMKAIELLEKGLIASRTYKQQQLEALLLLSLGDIYGQVYHERSGPLITYRKAFHIFQEMGDIENITRTKYLLAHLHADKIFPHLLDLLKSADENYCHYYRLRQWKNQCEPFWRPVPKELMDDYDPIYCLLEK